MSMHEGAYTTEDILRIAKTQLEEEEQLSKVSRQFIFTDTEFIIAKTWCEDVFAMTPDFILQMIEQHRYDLYLLTANDLPWIADPVRVNPQRREHFFKIYKRELEHYGLPFEIVTGKYEARLFNSISFIRKHFGEVDQ
jgi:nicotinamide riboside kinase